MKYAWATNEIFSFLRCLIFRSFSQSIHGMHYSDASKFHIFRSRSSNKGDKSREPTSIRSRNFSALVKVNFHSLSVESKQQTRKINIIHELGISNRKLRSLWSKQIYSQRLLEPLGDGNPFELKSISSVRIECTDVPIRVGWNWFLKLMKSIGASAEPDRALESICNRDPLWTILHQFTEMFCWQEGLGQALKGFWSV